MCHFFYFNATTCIAHGASPSKSLLTSLFTTRCHQLARCYKHTIVYITRDALVAWSVREFVSHAESFVFEYGRHISWLFKQVVPWQFYCQTLGNKYDLMSGCPMSHQLCQAKECQRVSSKGQQIEMIVFVTSTILEIV